MAGQLAGVVAEAGTEDPAGSMLADAAGIADIEPLGAAEVSA